MENFLFIGDSLTFGYGVTKNKGFVNSLASHLSFNIINKGINGDTTPSMLIRLYEELCNYKPTNLFIMGGTNDLLCGRTPNTIIENIEEMIMEGINNSATVMLGIPPTIIPNMAEKLFMPSEFYTYTYENLPILREKLINLCKNYKVKFIDFHTLTENKKMDSIFIDGIHLNDYGNSLLLKEFIGVFKC